MSVSLLYIDEPVLNTVYTLEDYSCVYALIRIRSDLYGVPVTHCIYKSSYSLEPYI